jgi:hypothetical protein
MSNESPINPGAKSSSISIPNGVRTTLRTIVLSPSQEVEKATLLQGVCYLCAGGVALSLLTTRAMMILFGTWEEEYENSLEEILGSGQERKQIVDGIASWFTKTGPKVGNK